MKYTPGPVISVASGSQGGTTFSHNRFGPYTRTRAVGVNPNTSRQQAARNRFSALAALWSSTLTQVQRNAWNLYGSSVAVKDKLGQDIFLTGFNHYIRSNTVALAAAVPRIDDGPTIFTLADTDPTFAAAISEATQLISTTFDDTLGWVNEDDGVMQIAMSRPVSVGRAFIPPTTRVAGFILGDGTTPPTSPATQTAPFAVVETQSVIVEGRILRADGRLSDPFPATVTVAA